MYVVLFDRITKLYSMVIIFLLIALGILVSFGFLLSFFWATKSGQYDDDVTPSIRMLFDDQEINQNNQQE